MNQQISAMRGSRHTRVLARILTGVLALGIIAVGWGVVASLNSEREQVGLMAIDPTPEPAAVQPTQVIAPSRQAPAGGPAEVEVAMLSPLRGEVSHAITELPAAVPADTAPTFDGRPLRKVKTMRMLTTAYSPDNRSCGIWADGVTASGYSVWTNGMKLVAADTKLLPFGSIISIPGYHGGRPVPVLDRGGRIKGNRLDVLYPTHERALQWGVQRLDVTVWEYAD